MAKGIRNDGKDRGSTNVVQREQILQVAEEAILGGYRHPAVAKLIAGQFGLTERSTHRYINMVYEKWRNTPLPESTQIRVQQLERLSSLYEKLSAIRDERVRLYEGLNPKDQRPVFKIERMAAIKEQIKIEALIARIAGTEMPVQVAAAAKITVEVKDYRVDPDVIDVPQLTRGE